MSNMEKVIKGLEHCSQGVTGCDGCVYRMDFGCRAQLAADALALLKEQELQNEFLMKKCIFCPHCKNCDVDDNGLLKDQEPKTGKWILDDDDANTWKCSECGDLQQINDGTPYENGWYFCPHCGTKLEEQVVKCND